VSGLRCLLQLSLVKQGIRKPVMRWHQMVRQLHVRTLVLALTFPQRQPWPKPAPALLIRSTPPAQATPPTVTLIALPTSVRAPPRLTALTVRGLAAHTQLHERLCALTSSSPVIAAVARQAATMLPIRLKYTKTVSRQLWTTVLMSRWALKVLLRIALPLQGVVDRVRTRLLAAARSLYLR
jgi:hypothetical protein